MTPEDIEARDIEQVTRQAEQEEKLGWVALLETPALIALAARGMIKTMTDAHGVRLFRIK